MALAVCATPIGNLDDVTLRVLDELRAADVVLCHHVLHNVVDLPPFLRALTAAARRGVVVEMLAEHPLAWLDPLWLRFHDLRRPPPATVDDAVAVHDMVPGFARFLEPDKLAALEETFPPVEHPVVRIHPETGQRTLFVNASFTTHIVGMDPAESDALLRHLYAQAHTPEFQVRHRWAEGTVAFWDNRATQHYAVGDYGRHVRVAERVAIKGGRPF